MAAIPEPVRALIAAYFCEGATRTRRGSADDVAAVAIRAIEAGIDAPSLGVLARLSGSLNVFEMEALFRDLLKELGLSPDDLQSAIDRQRPGAAQDDDVEKPVARSAYLVEVSNAPGGASLAHVHACATLNQLKQVLAYYFTDHVDITAGYGDALAALWIVQSGKLVGHIDLRGFLDVKHGLNWQRLSKVIPPLRGKRAAPEDLLSVDVSGFTAVPRSCLPFGEVGPLELTFGWNDLQYDEPPPDDWPL